MTIFSIGFKSIKYKPLNSGLSILLLGFGIGLIMILFSVQNKFEGTFTQNIKDIDLVVGAKGSPLQLILSSVYHIDAPTGNINLKEFEKLAKNPMVKSAIPLSFGDSYQGYRIVGTNQKYAKNYSVEIAQGSLPKKPFEVCLGSKVAFNNQLKLGDTFLGNHGLTKEGEAHEHNPYVVVGIYKESTSVIDKLIITPLESVWLAHSHNEEHKHEHEHHIEQPKEITAGLIQFKSAMATMMLPRQINENTNMQAALPSIEINRLFALAESAIKLLNALGYLLITIAVISLFIALYQSLKDEEPQLAYLRTLGASRFKLFKLVLIKGVILCVLGYLCAVLLSQLALWGIGYFVENNYQYSFKLAVFNPMNLILLLGSLALGLITAIIPAIKAYRLNISKTLANA